MMAMKNFYQVFFILIIGLSVSLNFAQENKVTKLDNFRQNNSSAKVILSEIENGIARGNVGSVFKYLGSQTYFSLSSGIRGYYSSNQAYYILEDFFRMYQVISFRFQSVQANEGNPYATGIYIYEFKGKRETSQVYISLKNTGKSWKITQLTFN
jgi:hypothetical protein